MKPKTRLFLKVMGWTAGVAVAVLIGAGATVAVLYARYEARAAKFDLTKVDDVAERSAVYDAHGEFYSYFGGENRLVVPLAGVSKHFINAVLAREDSRFWEHHGVDYRGIARALLTNVSAGETKQGASTITQQLARNACGLGERTFDRKALEAVLARHIDAAYPKEKILEMYVNRIYFGAGYYGIETAARGYFDKPASELTLGESATLAGLIRSPTRLAPSRDLDAAMEARDSVLARMVALHLISGEEQAAAQAQQLKVVPSKSVRVANDATMDAVLRELSSLLSPETLEYGGLRVSMTIDPALQRLAQLAADRRLTEIEDQKNYPHPKKSEFVPAAEGEEEKKPTDYLQAAVVLIDNRTGAIRAAVGARDYTQSKYQRALVGQRQIGSTFKPFVYATAFERGLMPGTFINDDKIAPGEFSDLPKKWSPENSDGEYGGMQPASFGLIKSRNTMSVRVGEFATLAKVRETARTVGLSEHVPDLPVVFLGAFEATVRDVTAAYTIFPNHGVYRAPFLISKVEDRNGRVLWKTPEAQKQVISADTAWMTSALLQQVMKSGTAAKASALGWKKSGAGKTGTTNDFFDAWFVGYTTSMTCGVWVGMDQPQTILPKGYGSALALPIWVDVMRQLPENEYPASPLDKAVATQKATLCSVSGQLATSACVAQRLSYDVELPASRIPQEKCRAHPDIAPVIATVPATSAPVPTPVPATVTTTAPIPAATPLPQIASGPATTVSPAPPVAATTTQPVTTLQRGPAEPAGVPVPFHDRPAAPVPETPRRPTIIQMAPATPALVAEKPSPRTRRPSPPPQESVTQESAPAPAGSRSLPRGVEVRRAVPVDSTAPTETATPPKPTPLPDGISERRIVERLPDGRTRTTVIRTVRGADKEGRPRSTDRSSERGE